MKNEKELQPYRFRKKETTRGPRKANEKKKKTRCEILNAHQVLE